MTLVIKDSPYIATNPVRTRPEFAMGIHSIMGPSLQGVQSGLQGLRRVASEIASNSQTNEAKSTDLSRTMVEMQQHSMQAKASIKALQTANDTLGTLFDESV
jgi:hypothetical protein